MKTDLALAKLADVPQKYDHLVVWQDEEYAILPIMYLSSRFLTEYCKPVIITKTGYKTLGEG